VPPVSPVERTAVPSIASLSMVTVVPDTEVVTRVPPVKVRVPLLVIAVPLPESAAGVMLVTVPLLSAVMVTVVPDT